METIVVLIAIGPNSVEVPCRIFSQEDSLDSAKVKCDKLFDIVGKEIEIKNLSGKRAFAYDVEFKDIPTGKFYRVRNIVRKKNFSKYKDAVILPEKVINSKVKYVETFSNGKQFTTSRLFTPKKLMDTVTDEELLFIEYNKEETLSMDIIIGEKVFTSYYGGCGEVWHYILKEVEVESKITSFNLD